MLGALLSEGSREVDVVCPIPSGGVPVGLEIARATGAMLSIAVVRKVQIPGNPEAGFGAVAWDGTVNLNRQLSDRLGLTPAEINEAIAKARSSVEARLTKFSQGRRFPRLDGLNVVLTDDGLASGYTMLAAVGAVHSAAPSYLAVAVPTGSAAAVNMVAQEVDEVVCLNLRAGFRSQSRTPMMSDTT